MYVIVAQQHAVIGPFQSEEEAIAYGKANVLFAWYVRPIVEPLREAEAA